MNKTGNLGQFLLFLIGRAFLLKSDTYMLDYKLLSIDESGKAAYSHASQLFILSGVVIPERYKPRLDLLIRKLKKRYFNDEEIVFHSRDMLRRKGPFSILRDHTKELRFWSDFVSIINNQEIDLFFVVADKNNAKSKGWQQHSILKRAYLTLLNEFASKHLKPSGGKIILESDPAQDRYLIEAHNTLQGSGTEDKKITAGEYQNLLTCLSLVAKLNLDVDVQIADSLAPIAGMMYKASNGKSTRKLTKLELMKKRLIDRKIKQNSSFFGVII